MHYYTEYSSGQNIPFDNQSINQHIKSSKFITVCIYYNVIVTCTTNMNLLIIKLKKISKSNKCMILSNPSLKLR